MWVAAYVSPSRPHIHVLVPKPKPTTTPRSRLSFAVSSGNSPPPQVANFFGSVGRTLLTVLEANPNPKPKPTTQEEGKEEGVKQISGSDVLWALRKAGAKKNKASGKKNKNKKNSNSNSSTELSSSSSRARHGGRGGGGGGEEDYTNVRPLRVKSEWSGKLDELEKQLQDLSHTK